MALNHIDIVVPKLLIALIIASFKCAFSLNQWLAPPDFGMQRWLLPTFAEGGLRGLPNIMLAVKSARLSLQAPILDRSEHLPHQHSLHQPWLSALGKSCSTPAMSSAHCAV